MAHAMENQYQFTSRWGMWGGGPNLGIPNPRNVNTNTIGEQGGSRPTSIASIWSTPSPSSSYSSSTSSSAGSSSSSSAEAPYDSLELHSPMPMKSVSSDKSSSDSLLTFHPPYSPPQVSKSMDSFQFQKPQPYTGNNTSFFSSYQPQTQWRTSSHPSNQSHSYQAPSSNYYNHFNSPLHLQPQPQSPIQPRPQSPIQPQPQPQPPAALAPPAEQFFSIDDLEDTPSHQDEPICPPINLRNSQDSLYSREDDDFLYSSSYHTPSSPHSPHMMMLEQPSRNLFIRNISNRLDEKHLRECFSKFGELRRIQTHTRGRGFVIVSYYDIRHAELALRTMNRVKIFDKAIDIHYACPKSPSKDKSISEQDLNQGVILVHNCPTHLAQISTFAKYGEIHRFTINQTTQSIQVEYFNSKHAENALKNIPKEECFHRFNVRVTYISMPHFYKYEDDYSRESRSLSWKASPLVVHSTGSLPAYVHSNIDNLTHTPSVKGDIYRTNSAEQISRSRSPENTDPEAKKDNDKYILKIEDIARGLDERTSLMIRNIPNKYAQKELLKLIDNKNFAGKYDFFYLPIDFNNKCNYGYAFINFIHCEDIIAFYLEFHGKTWDKYLSAKVANICYARIQGRPDLIRNFQNSPLLSEHKDHQPILFYSDGERKGEPEPWPTGAIPRSRVKRQNNQYQYSQRPQQFTNSRQSHLTDSECSSDSVDTSVDDLTFQMNFEL